ncbi:MAG: GlcG/HbpS family heme-binding protein, partial [Candidatus Binatia bacterium]
VGSAPNFPRSLDPGPVPAPPLLGVALRSLVVFIDGIRLPFVNKRFTEKVPKGRVQRPKRTRPGTAEGAEFVVEPRGGACFDESLDANGNRVCLQVPEGYLVGPLAGSKLTVEEVDRMVRQALDTANRTRAVIRLPIGRRTRMMIAVSDLDGTLLAVFRMPDATIFSIDVSTAKARNVAYFTSLDPNATFDLRDAERNEPGLPPATAVTNRTISFAAQPLYPSGIDGSDPGPFFRSLYVGDTLFPCTQGTQAQNPNQSGIVFFPGSLPLYKNGELVGGLGVSGDGVEQDDFVTVGGAQGFEPADSLRADQFFVRNVRSAYLKFPRNPER